MCDSPTFSWKLSYKSLQPSQWVEVGAEGKSRHWGSTSSSLPSPRQQPCCCDLEMSLSCSTLSQIRLPLLPSPGARWIMDRIEGWEGYQATVRVGGRCTNFQSRSSMGQGMSTGPVGLSPTLLRILLVLAVLGWNAGPYPS